MLKERWNYLLFSNGYCNGKQIWMIHHDYPGLFSIELDTFQVQFHGMLPVDNRNFRENFFLEGVLYFLPIFGQAIVAYELEKGKIRKIKLDKSRPLYSFTFSTRLKNNIWMFPLYSNQPLIKMNVQNKRIQYYENWNKDVSSRIHMEKYSMSASTRVNNSVYTPVTGMPLIIETNLENGKVKIHKFASDCHFYICNSNGDDIYVTMTDCFHLLIWNTVTGEKEMINVEQNSKNVIEPYTKVLLLGEELLLFAWKSPQLAIVNLKSKKVQLLEYPQDYVFFNGEKEGKFWGYYINGKKIILYPRDANGLLSIDLETYKLEKIEIHLPQELDSKWYWDNIASRTTTKAGLCLECKAMNLDCLIGYIRDMASTEEGNKFGPSNYGKKIYEFVKEE